MLLQTNINNTRSDVALLIKVLLEISQGIEARLAEGGERHRTEPDGGLLLGLLVAVATIAAQRPPLDAQSLSLGDENSWIRVQNVGDRGATVDVTLYDGNGNRVAGDSCPKTNACAAVPPGAGWSFFQQGYDGLTPGYRGAAIVKSDQPFVALQARDAFKGGQFQIDGVDAWISRSGYTGEDGLELYHAPGDTQTSVASLGQAASINADADGDVPFLGSQSHGFDLFLFADVARI